MVAAAKTQKRPLTSQPSSTLTSISQLSGLKNQKRPESLEPAGTTRPTPVWPSKSRHSTSTRKRSPLTQRAVGVSRHSPASSAPPTAIRLPASVEPGARPLPVISLAMSSARPSPSRSAATAL